MQDEFGEFPQIIKPQIRDEGNAIAAVTIPDSYAAKTPLDIDWNNIAMSNAISQKAWQILNFRRVDRKCLAIRPSHFDRFTLALGPNNFDHIPDALVSSEKLPKRLRVAFGGKDQDT